MKRMFALWLAFLLMVTAAPLFGKAPTSKIKIQGSDLKATIEITDPKILRLFRVWAGPATSSNEAQSLIVDWSQEASTGLPKGLQRYEVSFYAKLPNEQLIYVVFYEHDASQDHGYVCLPGTTDKWYGVNVGTIWHGVEGKCFRAWGAWERVADPLIEKAKMAVSDSGRERSFH